MKRPSSSWISTLLWDVDTYFALVFLAAAIAMIADSADMGRSASLFPRIVSWTLVGMVLLQGYRAVRDARAQVVDAGAQAPADPAHDLGLIHHWYAMLLATIVYLLAIYILGFLVSSFLLFVLLLPLIGRVRPVVAVLYGACISFGIWYSFREFFRIFLPQGFLW